MFGGDFYYLMGAKVHFERPTDSKNLGQRSRDRGVQLLYRSARNAGTPPSRTTGSPPNVWGGFFLPACLKSTCQECSSAILAKPLAFESSSQEAVNPPYLCGPFSKTQNT